MKKLTSLFKSDSEIIEEHAKEAKHTPLKEIYMGNGMGMGLGFGDSEPEMDYEDDYEDDDYEDMSPEVDYEPELAPAESHGYADGYDFGFERGYSKGYDEAYEVGYIAGIEDVNADDDYSIDEDIYENAKAKSKEILLKESRKSRGELLVEAVDVSAIIKEVIDTKWSKDNSSQMKVLQLLKGIATSDEKAANDFMAKIDNFTSSLKTEDFK